MTDAAGRRVLLVAFHFPPIGLSSGVHRTLSLVKYLPATGWTPMVLTADPRAYARLSKAQLADIPGDVEVVRALALDTQRHLAFRGRYPKLLALPDRWSSWLPAAVLAGLSLIRRRKVDLIWSTYPIASAHLIGFLLHRLSGRPWVADFRDSMTEDRFPDDRTIRRSYLWIEQKAFGSASRFVFTAPGAQEMYRKRYPQVPASRLLIVENGYDEQIFSAVEAHTVAPTAVHGRALRLVHSGIVYPSERDPRPFFAAIASLHQRGLIRDTDLRVMLRAPGHEDYLRRMIDEYGIGASVEIGEALDYPQAIAEMMQADGLLIFQAASCNHQIPAKLYEYLRCRRPILALTDAAGDTAAALRGLEAGIIVDIANQSDIETGLLRFMDAIRRRGDKGLAAEDAVRRYSRENLARAYARIFDDVVPVHRGGAASPCHR